MLDKDKYVYSLRGVYMITLPITMPVRATDAPMPAACHAAPRRATPPHAAPRHDLCTHALALAQRCAVAAAATAIGRMGRDGCSKCC